MRILRIIKTYNSIVTISIFIGIFIFLVAPYYGSIVFAIQKPEPKESVKYSGLLAKALNVDESTLEEKPKDNRLIIPSIGVDTGIFKGDQNVLLWGGWVRPGSSTPELGGNTVIAAHRYLYTNGPNTFYNLDKVRDGDIISVFWREREYLYEVYSMEVVPSSAVEIENNTNEDILTLYTCTPLWTSENRLVVKAKLLEKEN